jgi:hypothetical protein
MNIKKSTSYLFALVALVSGYLLLSPIARAAGGSGEDSKEVSQLLNDAKAEAHDLELDTHVIESFMKSNLSWESHLVKLNEIREHINRTGKLLAKLQGVRDKGTPWQQKAIDEIHPLLKELAANTKSTIDHFGDNKDRFKMTPTYHEYLTTNAQVAKELAALITDYVDYGFHEAELKRLGEKVVASER